MEKKCGNCKHYKETVIDCQGECAMTIISLDGTQIGSNGRVITARNCVYEGLIELSLDAQVEDYYNFDEDHLGVGELLSDVRIRVGKDFGCIYWEEK